MEYKMSKTCKVCLHWCDNYASVYSLCDIHKRKVHEILHCERFEANRDKVRNILARQKNINGGI